MIHDDHHLDRQDRDEDLPGGNPSGADDPLVAWDPVQVVELKAPRSPRVTARGMLLRALTVGAVAAGCALLAATFKAPRQEAAPPIIAPPPADNGGGLDPTRQEETADGRSAEETADGRSAEETADGRSAEPTAAAIDSALASVVVIRSNDAAGVANLGAGFVVGENGLIATNYHVMAEATEARATFPNGASYDIEGYVAVRPEEDLAVVRLREAPPLKPLPWSGQPTLDSLAAVVALGHPSGLRFSPSDGTVSRTIQSSQLPSRSRHFLRELVSPTIDHLWIQHTAGISPGSSGGPLITPAGEVVGVNTWFDEESRFGYALHVRHLQSLMQSPLPELAPLDRYAKPAARVAALLERLSTERIAALYEEAEAMRWLPRTRQQYETLQQLAWSVTVSSLPATFSLSDKLDTRLRELVTATDHVRRKLLKKRWNNIGQITVINELASGAVHEPMAGVVLFARVERIVEGPRGSRGMLMQISGQEQPLFVPLDGQLEHPPAGANCLLLGVNYDGQVVRYGDNPLQLIEAPVIISEMILPAADLNAAEPPP